MKAGASSGGGPSWFKRFFFNAVDQVDEFGVKNSRLKPIKIVGGILKLYVTVGGISALVCIVKEVYQDKKSEWDDFNFGDYGDCVALIATWGPEIFTNLVYNPVVDITTTDYENTPKDFAKWVKDKKFTDADYSDEDGYTYKDVNNNRQIATYDPKEKTFK